MTRIGLFIVVLALVAAPWLRPQAEDETSAPVLAGGAPRLLAAGVPAGPETAARAFRTPGSPPGTLFLERRLEHLPDRGLPRRTEICPAQAWPGEPGTAARGRAPADLCDVGRDLSRMNPCASPEDCPAYELWSWGLGAPGLQPARPERRPRTLRQEPPESPGDDR